MKLAAYVRVSTEKQVREGFGLDAQRAEIRAWAKEHGHRIVVWCADEGISGANGIETREGLYDALAAVRSRKVDGIVFTALDRLARRMTEQEGVLGEVWRAGGCVFSLGDGGVVLEDDPDDPMRTAIRQMRGVFAQLERGLIRQRMAKGKRGKAAQGGYVGGAPPFGFSAVDGQLVTNSDEQVTIARARVLRSDGMSLREIAAALDAEGLRARRGAWHPTSVRRLLE
jgi:DNA invertase Pin-like site-specific DNA recombinase